MTATIQIVGNLTRDPETRQAGSSTVTSLAVASNTRVRGEKKTTYYNVSVWGKSGEMAAQHLQKGSSVFVWGEHQPREYESNGEKRISQDVQNAGWTFAGPPAGSAAPDGGGGSSQDDDEIMEF